MRQLFAPESPLMEGLYKIFDCVCLSLLWIVCSVPVFTMGAASAALYTAAYRCLTLDEPYPAKTFFQAFREDFKRSTLAWLVVLGALAVLWLDASVFRAMLVRGDGFGQLYWVIVFLFCVVLTWSAYLSAYCARCNGSVREVLRISFRLMLLHPIRSAGVFLPILACLTLGLMAPGLAILLPGPLCWFLSRTIEGVLKLHMRPEDRPQQPMTTTELGGGGYERSSGKGTLL